MLVLYRLMSTRLLYWTFCVSAVTGMLGACSAEKYKAEADKEVYSIIENKWQESFGPKASYRIADDGYSPEDIEAIQIRVSASISLAEAVAIANVSNREYQLQKEELYLAALDLTWARHQFARRWFGTIDASYTKDGDDEQVGADGAVGFTQKLADGAQISAGIALDWARFLTGDPRTSLGSVLSASVTQPLLRGRGRKVAQEELTQAERTVLYQIRSFNRYRQSFVVSIVNDYYRVLQQRDRVANAQNNYKRVLQSKERLEMEAEAGRRTRIDVDEAEQNVLRSQNGFIEAQQRYEQMLDEFKIRLSLPTDADIELDQNELKALEEIGIAQPDYALEAAVGTALQQRLDLANTSDRVDDAERKIMVAADNLGAELNLVGSASVGSTEDTESTRLQFNRGAYTLGLEADLPLDRKAERNAYREALIALQQWQRQYENDVAEVKLDVRQAYRQLREKAESYNIQKMSLELAKRRVESNELLLDAGRVSVRVLLESQGALLEAQNSVTAALVDHAIAKLSFFRDIGILQVKPDGMWVQ